MKNNLKKLFAAFLVVVLGLSSGAVQAATTITVDDTKKGTVDTSSALVTNTADLIISQVNSGDTFQAYKILDVFYNQSTNVLTYEFTADFKAFLDENATYNGLTVEQYQAKTSGNTTSGSTITTGDETLDKLASAYAAYIKTNNKVGTALTVAGTTATLTAPAGSYLVLPTATTKIYAVMVGNLAFTADTTDATAWQLNGASIVAKVTEASVNKTVGNTTNSEGSYDIGDEFTYYITGTVPKYPTNATNKMYKITDTMSTGLTFAGIDSVVIQDGTTALTVATDGVVTDASGNRVGTVEQNGQVITFDFNVDYITSDKINIAYNAALNENASLGTSGNSNAASLTYSNDPYGTGTSTTEGSVADTIVSTYGIKITVVDEGSSTTELRGATFAVYRNSNLTDLVDTITTDANGEASVTGIKAGNYYLKETKAPTGYSLLRDPILVSVSADEAGTTGIVERTITNTQVGALPSTGGIGTLMFTLSGAALMIGAIWFVFIYRRKDNKQEA